MATTGAGPGQRKRLDSRAGTISTTVAFPADLHQRLTWAALARRWTLAEVLRTAAAEWLIRQPNAGRRVRAGRAGR